MMDVGNCRNVSVRMGHARTMHMVMANFASSDTNRRERLRGEQVKREGTNVYPAHIDVASNNTHMIQASVPALAWPRDCLGYRVPK